MDSRHAAARGDRITIRLADAGPAIEVDGRREAIVIDAGDAQGPPHASEATVGGHTATPWYFAVEEMLGKTQGFLIWHGNSEGTVLVAYCGAAGDEGRQREQLANARRIVACVNACDGISSSLLVSGFLRAVRQILADCAEDAAADGVVSDRTLDSILDLIRSGEPGALVLPQPTPGGPAPKPV